MSTRRILILTNRVPYPLNDGGNLAMKAMIDGYHDNGWEVFLLSMNTQRHYVPASILSGIYTEIASFETVDVDNSVKALSLLKNFIFSNEPEHADRFKDKSFANKVKQVIAAFNPTVVQVESIYLSSYLPLIRQCTTAKAVLRLHNIEYQIWERIANETQSILKSYYLRNLAMRIKRFEEKVWRQYDLLLPITSVDEQVVQKNAGDINTHVVPFGISVDKLQVITEQEKWVGYHIGAMDWLPNREGVAWFLKEVWPSILKKSPEFYFFFAGRNMSADFESMSIAGVSCEGEVADAAAFIADKKILIVPIQSGSGIRIKILEAMAIGKVVISTSVGMQGIDANPGIHYLLADTADEFSTAVKWCLDHKGEAKEMGLKAKELIVKHYDASQIAENSVENWM